MLLNIIKENLDGRHKINKRRKKDDWDFPNYFGIIYYSSHDLLEYYINFNSGYINMRLKSIIFPLTMAISLSIFAFIDTKGCNHEFGKWFHTSSSYEEHYRACKKCGFTQYDYFKR